MLWILTFPVRIVVAFIVFCVAFVVAPYTWKEWTPGHNVAHALSVVDYRMSLVAGSLMQSQLRPYVEGRLPNDLLQMSKSKLAEDARLRDLYIRSDSSRPDLVKRYYEQVKEGRDPLLINLLSPWAFLVFSSSAGCLAFFLTFPLLRSNPKAKKMKKENVVTALDKTHVTVGRFRMPFEAEATHLLSVGTTGVGKSQTMRVAARVAMERGQPALVMDYGSELLKRLYRPGKDLIIGVNDARCIDWSPLAEIRDEMDCKRVAQAMVPTEGVTGDAAAWREYGQTLVDACLITCLHDYIDGKTVTTEDFLILLNNSDETDRIRGAVPRTHAALSLLGPENSRMLASARAVAASVIKGLSGLPPHSGFHSKSLRDHVSEAFESGAWIFVPAPEIIKDQAMAMGSFIAGCVISYLFTKEDRSRRFWMFIDELGQYPAINSYRAALTAGRKYGVACSASVQTIAQLQAAYGKEGATTLLSCFGSKAIFTQGDEESANWAVREIGKKRMMKRTETSSKSSAPIASGGSNWSEGYSDSEVIEDIETTHSIMSMPHMTAWIHFAGHEGWKQSPIPYIDLGPQIHSDYEPRPFVHARRAATNAPSAPAVNPRKSSAQKGTDSGTGTTDWIDI